MKGACATTVFLGENWAHNSLNPKEENKVSFHALFSKGSQSIVPAVSFSLLYLKGAFEGRYWVVSTYHILEVYQKKPFTSHDSASSCSQLFNAQNSPNTQAVLLKVSHPSADPTVLRDRECFLELKNHTEELYMDSAACQSVAW